MKAPHRRHDISDKVWELLEPHLPGREGTRGVTAVIIEIFSMRFFGSCEQVLHGEICSLSMGTGKIPIAVFVDGEIVEFGKDYSKSSYPNQF